MPLTGRSAQALCTLRQKTLSGRDHIWKCFLCSHKGCQGRAGFSLALGPTVTADHFSRSTQPFKPQGVAVSVCIHKSNEELKTKMYWGISFHGQKAPFTGLVPLPHGGGIPEPGGEARAIPEHWTGAG